MRKILIVLSEWGFWGEELVGPLEVFDGQFHGNVGKETSVIVDYPFITGRSTPDSYMTGEKLVEVLDKGIKRFGWSSATKTIAMSKITGRTPRQYRVHCAAGNRR
jgi:hypothetical protein